MDPFAGDITVGMASSATRLALSESSRASPSTSSGETSATTVVGYSECAPCDPACNPNWQVSSAVKGFSWFVCFGAASIALSEPDQAEVERLEREARMFSGEQGRHRHDLAGENYKRVAAIYSAAGNISKAAEALEQAGDAYQSDWFHREESIVMSVEVYRESAGLYNEIGEQVRRGAALTKLAESSAKSLRWRYSRGNDGPRYAYEKREAVIPAIFDGADIVYREALAVLEAANEGGKASSQIEKTLKSWGLMWLDAGNMPGNYWMKSGGTSGLAPDVVAEIIRSYDKALAVIRRAKEMGFDTDALFKLEPHTWSSDKAEQVALYNKVRLTNIKGSYEAAGRYHLDLAAYYIQRGEYGYANEHYREAGSAFFIEASRDPSFYKRAFIIYRTAIAMSIATGDPGSVVYTYGVSENRGMEKAYLEGWRAENESALNGITDIETVRLWREAKELRPGIERINYAKKLLELSEKLRDEGLYQLAAWVNSESADVLVDHRKGEVDRSNVETEIYDRAVFERVENLIMTGDYVMAQNMLSLRSGSGEGSFKPNYAQKLGHALGALVTSEGKEAVLRTDEGIPRNMWNGRGLEKFDPELHAEALKVLHGEEPYAEFVENAARKLGVDVRLIELQIREHGTGEYYREDLMKAIGSEAIFGLKYAEWRGGLTRAERAKKREIRRKLGR